MFLLTEACGDSVVAGAHPLRDPIHRHPLRRRLQPSDNAPQRLNRYIIDHKILLHKYHHKGGPFQYLIGGPFHVLLVRGFPGKSHVISGGLSLCDGSEGVG